MTALDDALEAHLDATREARIASYEDFLRIPSISALPAHADDCRRAAEWLADATCGGRARARRGRRDRRASDRLRRLAPRDGRADGPGLRPLRRPAGRPARALWTSPPFEPVVRRRSDARPRASPTTRARSTSICWPPRRSSRRRGALPVNVRYVFEGEEESSIGPPRPAGSRRTATGSTADVAIISDTGFFEGNIPSITVGLRGIMYAQIDVVGTVRSTSTPGGYGGVVQNPANALATIIAALKGPDGRILVPGFYDDVVALTDADRAALSPRCRSTRRPTGEPRRAGARRRGRLHDARAQGRAGRRSTSTASGAASRARAPRRSSRPTPTPRSACRLVADQDPGADLRALPRLRRRRSRRPASRSTVS